MRQLKFGAALVGACALFVGCDGGGGRAPGAPKDVDYSKAYAPAADIPDPSKFKQQAEDAKKAAPKSEVAVPGS